MVHHERKKVANLQKRGNVFSYRIKIPARFSNILNIKEIRRSLKTSEFEVAKSKALRLNSNFTMLFLLLDRMNTKNLNEKVIKKIAQDFFEEELYNYETTIEGILFEAPESYNLEEEIEDAKSLYDKSKSDLKSNTIPRHMISTASELLNEEGYDSKLLINNPNYKRLSQYLFRAHIEALRAYKSGLEGNFDIEVEDSLFKRTRSTYTKLTDEEFEKLERQKNANDQLGKLINNYIQERKQDESLNKKSLKECTVVLSLLLQYFSDKTSVSTINSEQIGSVLDDFYKLPLKWQYNKKYKNKSISEIIDSLPENYQTLNTKTLKYKYHNYPNLFFKWCVKKKYIPHNPVPEFTLKIKGYDKERSFSPEQLELLFKSPVFTGCLSKTRRTKKGEIIIKDDMYWIPLLSLFTGMRINEIAQLKKSNLKETEHEGNPLYYLDLKDIEYKKTESSAREVPVHEDLVKLGFIKHVKKLKKDSEPIFKTIANVSNPSRNINRYFEQVGIKEKGDAQYSHHSFRHTIRDKLTEIDAPDSKIKAIMGHKQEDVTHGTYGKKVIPATSTYKNLNKIKFDCVEHLLGGTK